MNRKNMYSKLDTPTPLFEVSTGKLCRHFPYLWTQECADHLKNVPKDKNPYRCHPKGPVDPGQGYTGYPSKQFEYNLPGQDCSKKM